MIYKGDSMKPIRKRFLYFLPVLLLITILINGCAVQGYYMAENQMKSVAAAVQATVSAAQPKQVASASQTQADSSQISVEVSGTTHAISDTSTSQNPANLGEPTVRFALKTGMGDGHMAFIGVGGDLDGKVNPDLQVNPGDVVEIVLENGDNIQHNISLPDFGVLAQDVIKESEQTTVKFKVDNEGVYPYFCAIPGHRAAGMEGRLIVGNPPQIAGIDAPDLSRPPEDLPGPLNRSTPENVRIDLEAQEALGRLADGTAYTFWTLNGKIPGPFLRVRVGDMVEVHLNNPATNTMPHSVDFHAVTGPGGGAVYTQSNPGEETVFTFKALKPGAFVYHCASPMIPHHISNGMFGMILVEPEGGLPPVDKEFYVMQNEVYTQEKFGTKGELNFSEEKLLDEAPEYFLMNGSVGALTALHPLKANVGDTVRIFYGVGGPNFTSAFHVIGEIFDRVYELASLTAPPLTDVQTTLVPPGGATMVEFQVDVPGRYILVDHALSRLQRGLAGYLVVDGPDQPEIINGTAISGSGH
jgi:nitrite reductase (NO-forming)